MKKSRGQAALIVLLVMVVSLGFGLSIISQSTTDVKISKQEEEAARAFNAAEAGIEEALKNISGAPPSLNIDGIEVNLNVTGENFIEGEFKENEAVNVVLGGTGGRVRISWVDKNSDLENPGDCSGVTAESGETAASILVSITNKSNQVRRSARNACDLNSVNDIKNAGQPGLGDYLGRYELDVFAADRLMRVRPIYNTASIEIVGVYGFDLSDQTYLINSTAQTDTKESKAIEVTRAEPATPSIFDYVLFSGSNLSK